MTPRQHKFCEAYIETRNPREASLMAGYSPAFAKTKSYALLKNDKVREKIATLETEYYQNHFKELALKSINTLSEVLDNELSPASQLAAIRFILEQAGVSNKEQQESGTIQIKIKLPDDL